MSPYRKSFLAFCNPLCFVPCTLQAGLVRTDERHPKDPRDFAYVPPGMFPALLRKAKVNSFVFTISLNVRLRGHEEKGFTKSSFR